MLKSKCCGADDNDITRVVEGIKKQMEEGRETENRLRELILTLLKNFYFDRSGCEKYPLKFGNKGEVYNKHADIVIAEIEKIYGGNNRKMLCVEEVKDDR